MYSCINLRKKGNGKEGREAWGAESIMDCHGCVLVRLSVFPRNPLHDKRKETRECPRCARVRCTSPPEEDRRMGMGGVERVAAHRRDSSYPPSLLPLSFPRDIVRALSLSGAEREKEQSVVRARDVCTRAGGGFETSRVKRNKEAKESRDSRARTAESAHVRARIAPMCA